MWATRGQTRRAFEEAISQAWVSSKLIGVAREFVKQEIPPFGKEFAADMVETMLRASEDVRETVVCGTRKDVQERSLYHAMVVISLYSEAAERMRKNTGKGNHALATSSGPGSKRSARSRRTKT